MSKTIVIGTGRTPYIPREFQKIPQDKCFHLLNYLPSIEKLDKDDSFNFAVIGSGQSSVEIILDLLKKFPNSNVDSYIRNFSFKLKDTNPFIEKAILPKYTKYFYNLSYKNKNLYREDLKYINYSSADMDVLKKLNLHVYESLLKDKSSRFKCINNSNITNVIARGEKIQITAYEKYTTKKAMESYDFVILATGFKNLGIDKHDESIPPILLNISDSYIQNKYKFCHVNLDYSLQPKDTSLPAVYLNGLCETTHGMGDAGTFSLVSIRAKTIGDSISSAISN